MTNWCGSRSQTDTATGTCHGTRVKPLAAGASRASVRRSATVGRVHGWFTEGLDTLDLKEAKALLASYRCSAPAVAAKGRRCR